MHTFTTRDTLSRQKSLRDYKLFFQLWLSDSPHLKPVTAHTGQGFTPRADLISSSCQQQTASHADTQTARCSHMSMCVGVLMWDLLRNNSTSNICQTLIFFAHFKMSSSCFLWDRQLFKCLWYVTCKIRSFDFKALRHRVCQALWF